ncbi:hypothetical protein [Erythrobacter sp. THAF29]|uniref:hypothetical protein n=1 Tax=Erythrobacter sp. THAF29 TaxID=2587851 RepID=UPI001267A9BF|nr:hypothetical protein [Erythrobacter sp. THAF29]QFT78748.1 hypothetical protein FIU90_14455 [Erythrobacter sp. THAF29]
MDWPRLFLAGLKAAAMGSLIGTSLLTAITLVVGVTALREGLGEALFIMLLPFLVGFGCALGGLVIVGLPLTLWLKRKAQESRSAYLSGGLIGGGVVTMVVTWAILGGDPYFGLFIAFFGALTGGATGHFWWRYARQEEVEHNLTPLVEVFE